jgi:hypothetical protein
VNTSMISSNSPARSRVTIGFSNSASSEDEAPRRAASAQRADRCYLA